MNKLKTILKPDEIHLYAFSIVIAILGFYQSYFYALFIVLYYLVRHLEIKKIIIVVGLIFSLIIHIENNKQPKQPINGTYLIIDLKTSEYEKVYTLKGKVKILFKTRTDSSYRIGDRISIDGEFSKVHQSQSPGRFDYLSYLKSNRVFYETKTNNHHYVDTPFSTYRVHQLLRNYIQGLDVNNVILLESLLLARNDFDTGFKAEIASLGISHLFSVSGLHIQLFAYFLISLLFFLNQKTKKTVVAVFLVIYYMITLFKPTIFRAVFCYIFKSYSNKYTSLDILSFSFMISLLINPLAFIQIGFVFSYLLVFIFSLMSNRKGLKGMFDQSLIAQLVVLPFVLSMNESLNILSFFINPIFIVIFSYGVLPLSLLCLVPYLSLSSDFYLSIFINLINITSKLGYQITFTRMTYIFGLLFYLGFIFVFYTIDLNKRIKRLTIVFILFLTYQLVPSMSYRGSVYFLDVGQGDSSVIIRPFNKCNIVIDAFGAIDDFILEKRIKRIDYLIVTHGDYDHYQNAIRLTQISKVEHLVVSHFDDSEFVSSIRHFDNILYVKEGDQLSCGDIVLEILSPYKKEASLNDTSIVIKTKIDDLSYLFVGDIDQNTEMRLVNKYQNKIKSDVLKVPHHGSITSSSLVFVKKVNPRYAIISAGYQNKFNHPNPIVYQRYLDIGAVIYLTSRDYTIQIESSYNNRKHRIK